jgi:hypothetical protein
MRDDPFDIENLRLTPEMAASMHASTARVKAQPKKRARHQQFVMVPWTWVERLKGARLAATHMVAYYMLYQHWKTGGKPVPLSTVALKPLGVSRWAKWRALKELERLGLVSVRTHRRRVPQVTVL